MPAAPLRRFTLDNAEPNFDQALDRLRSAHREFQSRHPAFQACVEVRSQPNQLHHVLSRLRHVHVNVSALYHVVNESLTSAVEMVSILCMKPRQRDPRIPKMDADRRVMLFAVERLLDSVRRIKAAKKGRVLQ